MTSPAQIRANRQNARRSTGPRTPLGRSTSSQNGRRHGLTAAPPADAVLSHLRAILDDPSATPETALPTPLGAAALALAMMFWVVPPGIVVLAACGIQVGLFNAAVLATMASLVFWGMVSFGMGIPPAYALGFLLGAGMTLVIYLRSVWRGRRVTWRGREYGGTGDTG